MVLIAACETAATSPAIPLLTGIELSHLTRTVQVGETITITAIAYDARQDRIALPSVEWTSDDTTIASVDSIGRVTGQGWGYTTIRVSAGEVGDSIRITSEPAGFTIATLNGSPDLVVGESVVLQARFLRVGGNPIPVNRVFHWSSTNPSAVSISQAGLDSSQVIVTARLTGLASISVASEEWKANFMIGVLPEPVPAEAPVKVLGFYFFWYSTFAPILPTMEVEIAPGRSAEILRIDVAVSGAQASSFPALCSATRLTGGRHAILGEYSYQSQPFTWSPFPAPQTADGAALLTYRVESGRVIRAVVRGAIDVWGYDSGYPTSFPWQVCNA
jgi:hypothetical protein